MVSGRSATLLRAVRPLRVDSFITMATTVVVVGITLGFAHWHDETPFDAKAFGWLLAACVPLLWRGRLPLTVFTITSVLVFSYYLAGEPGGPAIISPTIALVAVAFLRGPLIGGIAGGVLAAVVIAATLVEGDHNGVLDPRLIGFVLWIAVAVGIGTMGRMHEAQKVAMQARVDEENRLRAEEQRLSIAREVHDVVAHSLAMINVQAGVAAHVADRRPAEAKAALLAIKDASRSALSDLRATLGVLRSDDERSPTPGLGRLPDLVVAAAAAGITVTVDSTNTGTDPDTGPLPAPVDVAAYRILQECLTNVVRHATDADTVTVRLGRTEDELEITVLDNGRPAKPQRSGGNGLRGMTERAQALGGRVVAGPDPAGGFRVCARLPLTGGGR